MRYRSASLTVPSSMLLEPLERRQLLSMVIDLRLPGGATEGMVTRVGQVIELEAWATITGSDNTGTNDGLWMVLGSFVSTNVLGGSALGNLSATPTPPFDGAASQLGNIADLDGDGDLDVGSFTGSGNFIAASDSAQKTGGVLTSNGQSFKFADLTFTVTQLLHGSGAHTEIQYIPKEAHALSVNAVWVEDDEVLTVGGNNNKGTQIMGSTVLLRRNIGTIRGKVYYDANADGSRQADEKGMSGWIVYIDSIKNGKRDPAELAVVTRGGNYEFNDLKAGVYRIRVVSQDGFRRTHPGGFHDVHLDVGGLVTGRNFGLTDRVVITGNVFNDNNNNGIKDDDEGPLAGWRVFVDLDRDGVFSRIHDVGVMTDADGNYTIDNLPPGSYILRASAPEGYTVNFPGPGGYGMTLAGGATVVRNFGLSSNIGSGPITVTGSVTLAGSGAPLVGWRVFVDVNRDGVFSRNIDLGIITDEDGDFVFDFLGPGSYHIRASAPTGYALVGPSNGLYSLNLVSGQSASGLHFSLQQIA